MRKLIAGALFGYLGVVAPAGAITNDVLVALKARLEVVVAALDPKPDIRIDPDPAVTILHAAYLPQTNKVHRILNKRGDVSTNVDDEVGPSSKGFVLYVRSEPKGSPNQLVLPQSGCDITPVDWSDQQLFWNLSSGPEADVAVLKTITDTIRQMKVSPNKPPQGMPRSTRQP